MLRLRPYKSCDAKYITKWIQDEKTYRKWGVNFYGNFPINGDDMNYFYDSKSQDENFMVMVAFDEDGVVGHIILRYMDSEKKEVRFGCIIIDDSKRGNGYGKEMLKLAADFAFSMLKAERITIGLYEKNVAARHCYESVGFKEIQDFKPIIKEFDGEEWKFIDMELYKPSSRYLFVK